MPPPKKEQLDVVWEKCIKEKNLGILDEWKYAVHMDDRYGHVGWPPLQRFAAWEQSKGRWRAIPNDRASGHNVAAELCASICTTSAYMRLAIVQRLFHLQSTMGKPREVRRSTRDMTNAFGQIARVDAHACFHIVAAPPRFRSVGSLPHVQASPLESGSQ